MFKKAIFSIGVLIFMHGAANAGLFDQLQKMGNKMQGKNGSVETSGQGQTSVATVPTTTKMRIKSVL